MSFINRLFVLGIPLVPKPIVQHFSRPYIAGETLADAVRVIKELNSQGMMATMDVLGEEISVREEAAVAKQLYHQALDVIQSDNLDANISVKLTQMGLKLDPAFCIKTFREVVEDAKQRGIFVRIDMEDSEATDDTIGIFNELRHEFDNIGIVLQSYLRRTLADAVMLMNDGPTDFRLCKGIYNEPRRIAYKDKEIIRRNFTLVLEYMLREGAYVGIATHDEQLVWEGMRLVRELGLTKDKYEFQMLLGVDPELRKIILDAGHRLRIYVPFGEMWYPYSMRRMKENPQIASYILRNIFRAG